MIGFILKLMLTRGLAMKRWNNFPRIEEVSHLDNVWFVIHIALFLAYLEEKNGNKVDKGFLIKRIIFRSFSSLIISDINSGTRDYIKQVDKDIFAEIQSKWFKYILEKEAPENIKKDIENIINNTSNTLELLIIKVSKKYAGFRECMVNEKVFEWMYDVPLKQINAVLEEERGNLKSLDLLLANSNYIKYLDQIRRLNHSMRWNQETRIFPISVMSHLVVITFISYIIWSIENDNWADIDIKELMLRSIYHDIPEVITGDIITPTKKAVDWFSDVLEKVEIKMMDDYIFSYLEPDYKDQVFNYMLKPFDWDLWQIAKHADTLSALFEAQVEINYWWTNFTDIYRNIKKRVNIFSTKSVDYMLKNWKDDFDKKIDNINLNEL